MLTEQMKAEGWIEHDGGMPALEILIGKPGAIAAIYRGDPDKPVKLFMPPAEQWEWGSAEPDIEIIAYRPENPND